MNKLVARAMLSFYSDGGLRESDLENFLSIPDGLLIDLNSSLLSGMHTTRFKCQ